MQSQQVEPNQEKHYPSQKPGPAETFSSDIKLRSTIGSKQDFEHCIYNNGISSPNTLIKYRYKPRMTTNLVW
jgi:hypothetical protein